MAPEALPVAVERIVAAMQQHKAANSDEELT
jgi:hypothetical protein